MERNESSERKSLLIKTLVILILLLLALMSTILYVFLYPKTTVYLFGSESASAPIETLIVRRGSRLNIKGKEKIGYDFIGWTYDDYGGEPLDPNREVEDEVVKLYANYRAKRITVTYQIRAYDAENKSYYYKTDVEGCRTMTYSFDESFKLPTGMIAGQLIPELQTMHGFHFAGWTTSPVSEDNENLAEIYYPAGATYTFGSEGDINFYAYWEKNSYDVYMHTGIEYEMNGSTPVKENGEFKIRNISDYADKDYAYYKESFKYLDYVTDLTSKYENITLTALNGTPTGDGVGYMEYDFVGWYLDKDYTLPVNKYLAEVRLDGDQPYFLFYDANGQRFNEDDNDYTYYDDTNDEVRIYAELLGLNGDNEKEFRFHLYSKWQRRAYNITFNKNAKGSAGKVDNIVLYKYDDEYGKYYDSGNYSREGYKNGETYTRINFAELFATEEFDNFAKSYRNYELYSLTTTKSDSVDGCVEYYKWHQESWEKSLLTADGNKINKLVGRNKDTLEYNHVVSENIALYAQWEKIYTFTFAYASGMNQKYFTMQGIHNQWFWLPDLEYIEEATGTKWERKHNYFAGWRSATNSQDKKELYKSYTSETVYELNPEFYLKVEDSNETFYVLWNKTPYNIVFDLNYDSKFLDYPVCYGNDIKSFPKPEARPGYIFNGWSKTKYEDNAYVQAIRTKGNLTADELAYTPSSTFTVLGDTTYYAVWTVDYVIEYSANGGTFNGNPKTSYKYSDLATNVTRMDLRANLYVGRGISMTKPYHTFVGWKVKDVADAPIIYSSSTTMTTFDLLDRIYYKKRSDNTNVVKDGDLPKGNDVTTITLEAQWEPIKFTVRIYDTLATSESVKIQSISLPYNQPFTFPSTNANGVLYDNKLGSKLLGFSTSQNPDTIEYLYTDPENMPTIEAGEIVASITFYTIYTQKEVNVRYLISDSEGYTPSAGFTSGKVPYGQVISKLPTPVTPTYPSSKYTFKYWYYTNADGVEVVFNTGDRVIYHDENDELLLYAKFELDEYNVNIAITNPYKGNAKVKTLYNAFTVEKGAKVQQELVDAINELIINELVGLFGEDHLDGKFLKGYSLEGVKSQSRKLTAGLEFSSSVFSELIGSQEITFTTSWLDSLVTIKYTNEVNSDEKTDENVTFGALYTSKGSDTFTNLGAGVVIKSWLVYESKDEPSGSVFIKCGETAPSFNNLTKYFTWNSTTGKGTLVLLANTEQTCTVNYYHYYNGDFQLVVDPSPTFVYGGVVPELLDGSLATYGDMKFAGWYYKGQKVDTIPVSAGNYEVDLYADLTYTVTFRKIEIVGAGVSYVTDVVKTINTLEYSNGTYSSKNAYVIDYYPEQSGLPANYNYTGVICNNVVFAIDDIEDGNAIIDMIGNNLIIDSYLTKTYTITYKLNDAEAKFDDGTTADKVHSYEIALDGTSYEMITILYSAEKKDGLYGFEGWVIEGDKSGTIYSQSNIFTPTKDTVFVAVFSEPTDGTIEVIIKLIKGDGTDTVIEYNEGQYKNGDKFPLLDTYWTSTIRKIVEWKDADGVVYTAGSDKFFNIPSAVMADQVFEFTAIWVEMFEVDFMIDDNHADATLVEKELTKLSGEHLDIGSKNTPTLAVDGLEFDSWIWVDSSKEPILINNKQVKIGVNDRIIFGAVSYKIDYQPNGSKYFYLPNNNNTYHYYFLSAWTSKTYDITLNIVKSDDPNTVLTDKTITLTVEYGTTLNDRDVLTADVLALESTSMAIVGWTATKGSTVFDPDALKNITSDLVLYAVWQNKLSLSFVAEDTVSGGATIGYTSSIATTYHLATEDIDINHLIKSIYNKGKTTVYFEDGKFIVLVAGTNEYYQLTGFSGLATELVIDANYTFPTFKISSNTTLTPVFTRVYKVSFYDNSTPAGGVESSVSPLYVKTGTIVDLTKQEYALSRVGFSFAGYNSNNALDVAEASIIIANSDVIVYAIWNSTRSAIFRINSTGNLYTQLFSLTFTKNNQISETLLNTYLADSSRNGNLKSITELQALGHPAYNYNFVNIYLNGYAIGTSNIVYSQAELLQYIFEGEGDVYITLDTHKIYTITYNAGVNANDIVGTMPNSTYFVNLGGDRIGQLVADGKFETITLPIPAVTLTNHELDCWSTTAIKGSSNYYSFNSPSDLELTKTEIAQIASNLEANNLTTYSLFLVWKYKSVDIVIYNLIDSDYTTLLDPYSVYNASVDGSTISFKKTPSWIRRNGNGFSILGDDGNFQTTNKQVSYNDVITFHLPSGINNIVGGYRLVGFSTTLYKLGHVGDYYQLDNATNGVTIDETIINNNSVTFYPVYQLLHESAVILVTNGEAKYSVSTALNATGYVSEDTNIIATTVTSGGYANFSYNKYSIITIVGDSPSSSAYALESINGETELTDFTYILDASTIFEGEGHNHDNYIYVVYAPKKLTVTFTLNYMAELIADSDDTVNISFTKASDNSSTWQLGKTNKVSTQTLDVTDGVLYVADNNQYYNYVIYNNGNLVTLHEGYLILLRDLITSSTPNADKSYNADITITAVPVSFQVSFNMIMGEFKENTKISATNTVYKNVTEFDIVDNTASVYMGSTITLPTADDILYPNGGAFKYFYLNGDESKSVVISKEITGKTTFIESYDRNKFSIQYYFNGKSVVINDLDGNNPVIIGTGAEEALTQDGLVFEYWKYSSGEKAFDQGASITLDRSYVLYAHYTGKLYNIVYTYENELGQTTTKNQGAMFGFDVRLMSDTDVGVTYADKYIYGWTVVGKSEVLLGGQEVQFAKLTNMYVENIVLNAVYRPMFVYKVSYHTDDMSNAGDYEDRIIYVKAVNEDGTNYDSNALKFNISNIAPVYDNSVDQTNKYFSHYRVKYEESAGNFVEDSSQATLKVGETLTLANPTTTIRHYRLFPEFLDADGTVNVEYIVTDPTKPDDDTPIDSKSTTVSGGASLHDNYLQTMTTISGNGNNTSSWNVSAINISFDVTANVDWKKYSIKEYKVVMLNNSGEEIATRTYTIGGSEDRNIAGSHTVKIYPIWAENYLIKYMDNSETSKTILSEYYPYNYTGKISILTLDQFNDIEDDDPSEDFSINDNDKVFVGWTINKNEGHVDESNSYLFGAEIEAKNLVLYPANAVKYLIKFTTAGVTDSDDISKFVIKSDYSLTTYYGSSPVLINSYSAVYSLCDNQNYDFVGFGLSLDDPNLSRDYYYNFNYEDLNNDVITISAVWDKISFKLTFKFDAELADGTKIVVSDAIVPVYSGDSVDLSFVTETTADGVNRYFVNSIIDQVYQELLAVHDCFKFGEYESITLSANNIYTPTDHITITVKLVPIYRVVFELGDATYNGEFVESINDVVVGTVIANPNAIENISLSSKVIKFWSLDAENNFFDATNKHTITADDLSRINLTNDYELVLYLEHETAYRFNLHYFASYSDMQNGVYTTLFDGYQSITYGSIIGMIKYNNDTLSYTSSLDQKAEFVDGVEIELASGQKVKINSLYELTTVFTGYISETLTVNNDDTLYYIWAGYDLPLYFVKTYDGDSTINDVYLVYSPEEYNIVLATVYATGDENNYTYSKGARNNLMAEYALTEEQLRDDGDSSVAQENRRTVIYNYAIHTSLVSRCMNDSLYVFKSDKFVRASEYTNNDAYVFVGWKMLSGDNLVDIPFSIDTHQDYYRIYNITSDAIIVAVFVDRMVEVEVTVRGRTENVGHTLDVKLELSTDGVFETLTDEELTKTIDAVNYQTIITFTTNYGNSIKISSKGYEYYEIYSIATKNGTFIAQTGQYLILNSYLEDNVMKIVVEYSIADSNIYISNAFIEVRNNKKYSTVSEIEYEYAGSTTKLEDSLSVSNNKEVLSGGNKISIQFNQKFTITRNAKIKNIVTSFNNHDFVKWQYIAADGTLQDIVMDDYVLTDALYLVAVYAPKTVTIKYGIGSADNLTTELFETTATYGETINLPYILYEDPTTITTGWNEGAWGATYRLINNSNKEQSEFVFTATTINNYKLQFINDYNKTQTFADYYVASEVISIEKGISFRHITNYGVNDVNEVSSDGIETKTSIVIVPIADVTSAAPATFAGWQTNSQLSTLNKYVPGDTYTFSRRDVDGNNIPMTVLLDTSIIVKFVITNPTTPANSLTDLTIDDMSNEINGLTYISVVVDLNYKSSLDTYIMLTESSSVKTEWNNKWTDGDNVYFTHSEEIANKYKFHGWSQSRSLADWKSAYTSDTSVTIYTDDYHSHASNTNIIDGLYDLIKNGTWQNDERVFYPIWEEKGLVTFKNDVDNKILSSVYYSENDIIVTPDIADNYNMDNGSLKWIGWEYGNTDPKTQIKKTEFAMTYFGAVTFTPLRQAGYNVTLDMNFDDWIEYFANVMQGYTGKDIDTIKAETGIPYFNNNSYLENLTGVDSVDLRGTTSYKQYKYTSLITNDEKILLPKDGVFTHTNIYNAYDLSDHAVMLDKYFVLKGWSYTKDGSEFVEEISNLSENITLYAIWEPITLSVDLYSVNISITEFVTLGEKKTTIDVAFGEDYATYSAKVNDSDIIQLFNKTGYRFKEWILKESDEYGQNSVLNSKLHIINNMSLQPTYYKTYLVRFVNIDGIRLHGDDYVQEVIDGEIIAINDPLKKYTDIDTVSSVYYLNETDSPVQIDNYKVEHAEGCNTGCCLPFVEGKWHVEKIGFNRYIDIVVDVSVRLNVYLPNKVSLKGAATPLIETYINLGQVVTVRDDYFTLQSGLIDSYATGAKLKGWYYSPRPSTNYYASDDAYLLNEEGVFQFRLVFEDNIYKLYICRNNAYTEDPYIEVTPHATDGLVINMYAKITIDTTVSLGSETDQDILDYATLSYDADTNKDYFVLLDSGIGYIGNRVKSYTYTTVLNSEKTPIIKVESIAGYIVNGVSGLPTFSDDVVNMDKTFVLNETYGSEDSQTTIKRGEVVRSYENVRDGQTGITTTTHIHSINIVNSTSIARHVISLDVIKYNITYSYDTLTSVTDVEADNTYSSNIRFSTSMSAVVSSRYTEGDNEHTLVNETPIYSGGKASVNLTLNYTHSKGYVTYIDVPYGTTIRAEVFPHAYPENYIEYSPALDELYYHFKEFKSIDETINLGTLGQSAQTFMPTIQDTREINLGLKAVMARNVINQIDFVLDFGVNGLDANTDPWIKLLNAAKNNSANADIIKLKNNKYQIKIKDLITPMLAGDSLTTDLLNVDRYFETTYNQKRGEINEGNLDLSSVLNYFLMQTNADWSANEENVCLLDSFNNIYAEYKEDGTTVIIHKDIKKAVNISVNTKTVDFYNQSNIIDADRADLQITGVTEPGNPNPVEIDEFYVYTGTNTTADVISSSDARYNVKNNFIIKMPYLSAVSIKVLPDGATNKHVAYESAGWVFTELYNNTNGDGSSAIIIDGDVATVNTGNEQNINQAWSKFKDSWNEIPIPDLKLQAKVVAKSYDVKFKDSANGSTLATVALAYDETIATTNAKYNPTLEMLYTDFSMPRFVLADNSNGRAPTFAHPEDKDATLYGEFKYIFKNWLFNGSEKSIKAILTNYIDNAYSDIELVANYESCKEINIKLYGVYGDEIIHKVFLPTTSFTDLFNTSMNYSNEILSLDDKLLPINNSTGVPYLDYYLKGSDNKSHTKITNASELSEQVSTIYPAITKTLIIYNNEVYSEDKNELTLITLGGRIDVESVTNSTNPTIKNGYLYLTNIVDSSSPKLLLRYDPNSEYEGYTFAYWKLDESNYLVDGGTFSYYSASPKLVAHYNIKISFAYSDGSLLVNNSAPSSYYELVSEIPSGIEITTNANSGFYNKKNIYIRYIDTDNERDGEGKLISEAEVVEYVQGDGEIVLYTIKYIPSSTVISRVDYKIYIENEDGVILAKTLKQGESYTFDDLDGFVKIEAIGYPGEVRIEFEKLGITNRAQIDTTGMISYSNANYTVYGGDEVTFTVFNNNALDNVSNFEGTLTVVSQSGSYYNKTTTITATNVANKIEGNVYNIRWQYLDTSGSWVDMVKNGEAIPVYVYYSAGSTLSNMYMKFRLACNWISSKVTFAGLYQAPEEIKQQSITMAGKTFSLNAGYSDYKINGSKDILTLTMFKGQRVEYVHDDRKFEIYEGETKLQTIEITYNNGYLYGWINSLARGVVELTIEDFTQDYYFYAWVEAKKTINVLVDDRGDNQNNFVAGYGNVQYQVIHPIDGKLNAVTFERRLKTYGSLELGESMNIIFTASKDNSVNHVFVNYNNNGSELSQNATYESVIKDLPNNLNVRFNANETKSVYAIENEIGDEQYSYTIYGGYTIDHSEVTNDSVVITISNIFGSNVSTIIVNYKEGTQNGNKYYPRTNYNIDDILLKDDSTSVVGESITSDGTDIVVQYDERIIRVQLSIVAKENGVSVSDAAYLRVDGNALTNINIDADPNESKHLAEMYYNLEVSGMALEMFERYIGDIKVNKDFKLISAMLQVGSANILVDYPNDAGVGYAPMGEKQSIEISTDKIELVVNVEGRKNRTLYIKSTLPYQSDLDRVSLVIDGQAASIFKFYTVLSAEDMEAGAIGIEYALEIDIRKGVTATTKKEGNVYILTITQANNTYLKITYTLPAIYSSSSSTGFMYATGDGYNMNTVKTLSAVGNAGYGDVTYSAWGKANDARELTTWNINDDGTIYLDLQRNVVTVTLDRSYQDKFKDSAYSDDDAFLNSYGYNSSETTNYDFPGGLGALWHTQQDQSYDKVNGFIEFDGLVEHSMVLYTADMCTRGVVNGAYQIFNNSDVKTTTLSLSDNKSFAIMSKNNGRKARMKNGGLEVDRYIVDLPNSTEWALIEIPGRSQKAPVLSIYANSDDKDPLVVPYSGPNITLNLYIEKGTKDENRYTRSMTNYLYKDWSTRGYIGLFDGKQSNDNYYGEKEKIFTPDQSKVGEWDEGEELVIIGYIVEIDGVESELKRSLFTNSSYILNVSGAKETIKICPIWDDLKIHSVKIYIGIESDRSDFGSIGYFEYEVIEGERFEISIGTNTTQNKFMTNLSQGESERLFVVGVGERLLMGFTVLSGDIVYGWDSVNLNLYNLNDSCTILTQNIIDFPDDPYGAGYSIPCAGFNVNDDYYNYIHATFDMYFVPTSDIELRAFWEDIGYTVEYIDIEGDKASYFQTYDDRLACMPFEPSAPSVYLSPACAYPNNYYESYPDIPCGKYSYSTTIYFDRGYDHSFTKVISEGKGQNCQTVGTKILQCAYCTETKEETGTTGPHVNPVIKYEIFKAGSIHKVWDYCSLCGSSEVWYLDDCVNKLVEYKTSSTTKGTHTKVMVCELCEGSSSVNEACTKATESKPHYQGNSEDIEGGPFTHDMWYSCQYCNGECDRMDNIACAAWQGDIGDDVSATCQTTGQKVETCMECGNTKLTHIPTIDHLFIEHSKYFVSVAATCEKEGYSGYTCAYGCGTVDKISTLPMLEHKWERAADSYYTEASCTIDGSYYYHDVCANCGEESKASGTIKAIGHPGTSITVQQDVYKGSINLGGCVGYQKYGFVFSCSKCGLYEARDPYVYMEVHDRGGLLSGCSCGEFNAWETFWADGLTIVVYRDQYGDVIDK